MIELRLDADKIERWAQVKPRHIQAGMIRALRRTGTAVQAAAVELFRRQGVGRSVFGKKAVGARKIIRRSKLRIYSDGSLGLPIKAYGLAEIQETGGRTKPHVIKPKLKKILKFGIAGGFGFGGDAVFAKEVQHPGATHPAMPFLERAARQESGRFRVAMETELAAAMAKRVA